MFIFFLINLIISLGPQDDPYKILGVPKTATKEEIKKAYRKLTYSLHPDISKTRETEKEWIRVNEAYEILSDPDAKYAYDHAQTTEKETKKINFMDDPMGYTNFDGFDIEVDKKSFIQITENNFDEFVKKDGDYLFLVYTSLLCSHCNVIIDWFEEFKNEQTAYLHFGVIDTSSSAALAKSLGAEYMPSLIYINVTDGQKHVVVSKDPISSYRSIVQFYKSQLKVKIAELTSESSMKAFLMDQPDAVHVIQYVKKGATVHYMRMAHRFSSKYNIKFAVQVVPVQQMLSMQIKKLPTVVIIRNSNLPIIQIDKMKELESTLEKYHNPLYWEFNGKNFHDFCKESCFIRVGYPNIEALPNQIVNLNASIGVFAGESGMRSAYRIELHPNQFIYVKNSKGTIKFADVDSKMNDYKTINSFLLYGPSGYSLFPPGFIPDPPKQTIFNIISEKLAFVKCILDEHPWIRNGIVIIGFHFLGPIVRKLNSFREYLYKIEQEQREEERNQQEIERRQKEQKKDIKKEEKASKVVEEVPEDEDEEVRNLREELNAFKKDQQKENKNNRKKNNRK